MLSPLRRRMWGFRSSCVIRRVGRGGIRRRRAGRRASRTDNHSKVLCTLGAARNIFRTQRRVKGAKHREAASP